MRFRNIRVEFDLRYIQYVHSVRLDDPVVHPGSADITNNVQATRSSILEFRSERTAPTAAVLRFIPSRICEASRQPAAATSPSWRTRFGDARISLPSPLKETRMPILPV